MFRHIETNTAGVPCLGIGTDDYTWVKLEGALAHAGRTPDTCHIWQAATAQVAETFWRCGTSGRRSGPGSRGTPQTWRQRES
jgi:hypothetical protein